MHFEYIVTGMVIFITTGTDDLLVMAALMNGKKWQQSRQILWGTLIGTAIMFSISIALAKLVHITPLNTQYLRFAAIVPLMIGILYARKSFDTKNEDVEKVSQKDGLATALLMYLSNASDDLIINSSTLITMQTWSAIASLGLGNLIGVIIYFLIAGKVTTLSDHPRFIKMIWGLAGAALITIGLRILLT